MSRLLVFMCVVLGAGAAAAEPGTAVPDRKPYLAALGGFGESHPGWGDTIVRVRTLDVVLRYGRILTGHVGRDRWRWRHEMLIEVPVALVVEPGTNVIAGVNFLACFTFDACLGSTRLERMVPYVFAGGGPVYIVDRIEGMGSRGNGNYQFGAGARYPVGSGVTAMVEGRFHHVSNAGTAAPNYPLNSAKFLAGVELFR